MWFRVLALNERQNAKPHANVKFLAAAGSVGNGCRAKHSTSTPSGNAHPLYT